MPSPSPQNYLDLFPDLKPGDFGTCAVVAVGENVLHRRRGPEIDAHDTVFRYNSPIKKCGAPLNSNRFAS